MAVFLFCPLIAETVFVKGRVEGVEVFGVKLIGDHPEGFSKPLVMHYLTLTQEDEGISDIGVIDKTQNVVVGHSCLLLCGEVFV